MLKIKNQILVALLLVVGASQVVCAPTFSAYQDGCGDYRQARGEAAGRESYFDLSRIMPEGLGSMRPGTTRDNVCEIFGKGIFDEDRKILLEFKQALEKHQKEAKPEDKQAIAEEKREYLKKLEEYKIKIKSHAGRMYDREDRENFEKYAKEYLLADLKISPSIDFSKIITIAAVIGALLFGARKLGVKSEKLSSSKADSSLDGNPDSSEHSIISNVSQKISEASSSIAEVNNTISKGKQTLGELKNLFESLGSLIS